MSRPPPDLCRVFAAIDAANALDPNMIEEDGESHAAELVYGRRMSAALERLYPRASDELRIAARAQHIRRWTIPRADYPMDRKGYLRWRNDLKRRHAEIAGEIMAQNGFSPEQAMRVGVLLRKEGLKRDEEVQALEDVICIVFLEYYLAGFASKHEDEKIISILRKTWGKMSPHGHEAVRALDMPGALASLVEKALVTGEG